VSHHGTVDDLASARVAVVGLAEAKRCQIRLVYVAQLCQTRHRLGHARQDVLKIHPKVLAQDFGGAAAIALCEPGAEACRRLTIAERDP
jgi:hypothetical protein